MTSEAAMQPPKNPENKLIPISLYIHLSIDGLEDSALAYCLGYLGSNSRVCNGHLSNITTFLFISRD